MPSLRCPKTLPCRSVPPPSSRVGRPFLVLRSTCGVWRISISHCYVEALSRRAMRRVEPVTSTTQPMLSARGLAWSQSRSAWCLLDAFQQEIVYFLPSWFPFLLFFSFFSPSFFFPFFSLVLAGRDGVEPNLPYMSASRTDS